MQYIIVQAGGKGTRLENLTRNKPKALVPINNLPMIFHLFKKFIDSHFIIIGDCHFQVLEKYLAAFATVSYELISSTGYTGTCAGIKEAVSCVPENHPFMIIWSDLVLPPSLEIPEILENYVGISKDFPCRWSYRNGAFLEEASISQGVAGMFLFQEKKLFFDVPDNGEFVRWLSQKNLKFSEFPLHKTREYGLIAEVKKLPQYRCRPFNKITELDGWLTKEGIDEQGKSLAVRECAWYQYIQKYSFDNIPQLESYKPLKMKKIAGKNVYAYTNLSFVEKCSIVKKIITSLKRIHSYEKIESNYDSYLEAYVTKTFDRIHKVEDLIPFSDKPHIIINGKSCKNILFYQEQLIKKIKKYFPDYFVLLHGDCTFSNIILRDRDMLPFFIDPRGYFGTTELFGDPAYDWAKLYYSIRGNYDQFNLKNFSLWIKEKDICLEIESSGWENLEDYFFELLNEDISAEQIKLIHGIIWISLTTYAWEDYDSICGAFYNGLYYLEEVL